MTYLVASGVLDTEPEELVDGASGCLACLHALLEAGPALGDGALLEVHGGADGIPVDLVVMLVASS
jgi:hypothetical protein